MSLRENTFSLDKNLKQQDYQRPSSKLINTDNTRLERKKRDYQTLNFPQYRFDRKLQNVQDVRFANGESLRSEKLPTERIQFVQNRYEDGLPTGGLTPAGPGPDKFGEFVQRTDAYIAVLRKAGRQEEADEVEAKLMPLIIQNSPIQAMARQQAKTNEILLSVNIPKVSLPPIAPILTEPELTPKQKTPKTPKTISPTDILPTLESLKKTSPKTKTPPPKSPLQEELEEEKKRRDDGEEKATPDFMEWYNDVKYNPLDEMVVGPGGRFSGQLNSVENIKQLLEGLRRNEKTLTVKGITKAMKQVSALRFSETVQPKEFRLVKLFKDAMEMIDTEEYRKDENARTQLWEDLYDRHKIEDLYESTNL